MDDNANIYTQGFNYYIDRVIAFPNGNKIIVGWVLFAEDEVEITFEYCKDFWVQHILRPDVEEVFKDKELHNFYCGFEIYATNLNLWRDKLFFHANNLILTVQIQNLEAKQEPKNYVEKWQRYYSHNLEGLECKEMVSILKKDFLKYFNQSKNLLLPNSIVYLDQETACDFESMHSPYMAYFLKQMAGPKNILEQRKYNFSYCPLISIIVPTFNTPLVFLQAMLDSVRNQSYANWELCLADGSTTEEVYSYLKCEVNKDKRIKVKRLAKNKGIAGNSNAALEMASGEYVALLDHDDLLTPDALFEVVKVLNQSGEKPGLLYSDEDKTDIDGKQYFEPNFKSAFAPYTLRNCNYVCHFTVVDKTILTKNNIKFSPDYDGAQDYDFILRVTEKTNTVVHIPRVLYHWRVHSGSTAQSATASKPYTHEAGKRAVIDHLHRLNIRGKVEDGAYGNIMNFYRVRYAVEGKPGVSIIIPNCNQKVYLKRCVDSILKHTGYDNYEIIIVENNSTDKTIFDYYKELAGNPRIKILTWSGSFNYAAINNFAIRQAHGDFLALLNNDVEIITDDWLEEMLGVCQQKDVGVVGAKLYYENNTIQHAGVVLGMRGVANHCGSGLPRSDNGYAFRLRMIQNVSAVTGAFLMTKKSLYEKLKGLDERLAVAFNDIDYCMKIRQDRFYVIFDPYVEAYHFESKSRGSDLAGDLSEKRKIAFAKENALFREKWGQELIDPYYNPNFSLDSTNIVFRQ